MPVETRAVETAETRQDARSEAKPVEPRPVQSKPAGPDGLSVTKSTTAAPPAGAHPDHASEPHRKADRRGQRADAIWLRSAQADGAIGADTQTEIAKFERARKLPMIGQMSNHLVHELGTMIGHAIE